MRPPRVRRGFSLPEVIIALTVSLLVLAMAVEFSLSMLQGRRGLVVREGVDRNARFVGLSLARDVAEAGVALRSSPDFASLNGAGDTLTILSVPFAPNEAAVYPMKAAGNVADGALPGAGDAGADPADDGSGDESRDEEEGDADGVDDDGSELLPPGGTCGATCIDFSLNGQPQELQAGDVALLRMGATRRLLRITQVTAVSPHDFSVTFADLATLAGRPSGLGTLRLRRSETSIQRVQVVAYYRDASTGTLYRATSFSTTGSPNGVEVASPVEAFTAQLRFMSGAQAGRYDWTDADSTNDGDRIVGVVVRARMKADRADPSVNGGEPASAWYQWQMAPRNLLYEKNRAP